MEQSSFIKYLGVYIDLITRHDHNDYISSKICKNYKSRLTKENAQIDVKLTYKKGLDKYYGLIGLAEEAGIFKKVSTRYEMPDGSKVFGKNINDDPEKYFTKEVLDKIDEIAKRKFQYGSEEDEQ